jgi:prepilin-type N-terminal cleavage/methylation domain-containing protein
MRRKHALLKSSILSERGFTLVELLVVIAIIGLLATVSVVQFTRVQVRARAVQIISDFNTLEKALKLYADSQGRVTWWMEAELAGGATDFSAIVNTTSFSQFLAKAPLYKGKEYMYDNDGDTFDPSGTGCGLYGDGVNLYLDLNDTTIRAEIDRVIDASNGMNCGKITGGSTYVMYKIGNNSADLRL